MQPKLRLADPMLLAAGGKIGGYKLATTDRKCPPGYTYVPSQGTCIQLNDGSVLDMQEAFITIPMPDGTLGMIREDAFDNLDPVTWHRVMDVIEPFNTVGMNGLFSKWRENREARKEARNQRRIARIDARAAGRAGVASAGGGIGSRILNGLKGVVGAIGGGEGTFQAGYDPGSGVDLSYSNQPPWYARKEILIPAGIAAAVLVGYLVTRGKKRAA